MRNFDKGGLGGRTIGQREINEKISSDQYWEKRADEEDRLKQAQLFTIRPEYIDELKEIGFLPSSTPKKKMSLLMAPETFKYLKSTQKQGEKDGARLIRDLREKPETWATTLREVADLERAALQEAEEEAKRKEREAIVSKQPTTKAELEALARSAVEARKQSKDK